MKKVVKYLNPKNYIRFLIDKTLNIIVPIIRIFEKKYLEKYSRMPLKYQPIFIIGAPRTGSTILYQVITNQLDVLYIDNLACKFYRNLFFGFWLSDKLFKQKPHNCFTSKFGNTSECGLHAPSECGEFWYRWLPRDRHFIDYNDITDKIIEEIRREIIAIINYFNKPFIFKNLNAGQRLRLLRKCFPHAKFIFVKRDPLYVSQSILMAKRKLGLKDNEFWSIMPKNVNKLRSLENGYEQIVKQIFYIEKQIINDMYLFGKENFLIINYDDFIKKYNETINICQKFIGAYKRISYEKPNINPSKKITLSKEEVDLLITEIKKLDWENYNA